MKNDSLMIRTCDKNCYEHKFLFKPTNDQCWNKQDLDINYCP